MTLTADTQLAAAVDDALNLGGAPIVVPRRLATPAEVKAAAGGASLANAPGWGWAVAATFSSGWQARKRAAFTAHLASGEVWSLRDGKGSAPQKVCPGAFELRRSSLTRHRCNDDCELVVGQWGRVESLAIRLRHETGLRAVGLWTRWLGPHYVADRKSKPGRIDKPPTWSAVAPDLWWWRLNLATLGRPVPVVAYQYPVPVAVTDLKAAVASEIEGDDLVALFDALPVKAPTETED